MLGQRLRRWPNIEPTLNKCTMFERKSSCSSQQTQDICITFIQRRPNVFDIGPALHKVIQMFCVYRVSIQAFGVKQFPNPRSNTVSLFASQRPSRGKGKVL